MFNIVLVEPEIPANTGNIGRTCVVAGARLHLVRPLGFSLDAKTRRRAGLLYWDHLDVRIHDSWEQFLQSEFGGGGGAKGASGCACAPHDGGDDEQACVDMQEAAHKLHFATKKARKTYAQATYKNGDYLVFGKESTGLPEALLAQFPDSCERIPMLTDSECGFAQGCSSESEETEQASNSQKSPLKQTDICGNFVDVESYSVNALNLSNSVAIMLYEALRQMGFEGME